MLTAAQAAALVAVWWVFVRTARGQAVDAIAFAGRELAILDQIQGTVPDGVRSAVSGALRTISITSIVAVICVLGFIALVRRRIGLAVTALVLIVGANLSTQILKHRIDRPELSVDPLHPDHNSLPSGHTTVAASIAAAAVFVLPPRVRGFAAVVGAAYAALVGVATLAEGWHRPSDVVAALLVVGAWSSFVAAVVVLTQRGECGSTAVHAYALTALLLAGFGLLTIATLALGLTEQVSGLGVDAGGRRMFVAYAGSAAGITGTACMILALVVAMAPQISDQFPDRSDAAEARVSPQ